MSQLTPLEECVNTLEVEAMARRVLAPDLYSLIAGGDRRAFERYTFRPRLMVDTTKLDLSLDLFGQRHFAPLLLGPIALAQRFHPEGELALARGAAAAKAGYVLAGETSLPLEQIAPLTKAPLWVQLNPGPVEMMIARAKLALASGAKAVCLMPPLDWATVDRLRQAIPGPLLLKGVMSVSEAKAALTHRVDGLVLSNYRGRPDAALAAPLDVLPEIAQAVAGQVPLLVDGGLRRGSDALKALALGARAVLVARPAVWGLAAYGERGVRAVLEMLQTELARDMAMLGAQNLAQLTPAAVRAHRR